MKTLYGLVDGSGQYQFQEKQLPMHSCEVDTDTWPPRDITPIVCAHPDNQVVYNASGFGVCQSCLSRLKATGWEILE